MSPLVLEEDPYQLDKVDINTALQTHARVVGLHVEEVRCHSPFHQHSLACQVLSDHLIDSVKPPEGELDRPTVEPDHRHHVLVDEVDPVPGVKHSTLLVGSSNVFLIISSCLVIISFLSTAPFLISNPRYLYTGSHDPGTF